MDYDLTKIPSTYDAARNYDPETLAGWIAHIASHIPAQQVSDILDLGCGTGRFSKALAQQFCASVTGVDPSEKMLQQAVEKHIGEGDRIQFHCAPAERLPLADDCVDMIFLSMVYHHLVDKAATLKECDRVLRSKGYVVIRNSTSEQAESFPYVGYFSGVKAVIEKFQPSCNEVISLFSHSGFELISHEVVVHAMAQNWSAFTEKLKRKADSILARLPESDFEQGYRRCRRTPIKRISTTR